MNVLAFGDGAGHQMYERGDGWFPLGGILALLVLGGLAAAAIVFAIRANRRRDASAGRLAPPATAFAPAGPVAGPADDALNLVRLRYARGEMGRDEYLQTAADLGGAIVATPPMPAASTVPPATDTPDGG